MRTILCISLLIVSCGAFAALERAPKNAPEPDVVRMPEGFFLDGVEGSLEWDAAALKWNFRPLQRIELTKKEWPAGEKLPVLQSSVLEQMTKLAGSASELRVRLWAMATLYKHENYLYPVFFMPLKESQDAAAPAENAHAATGGQEDSILPPEILRQLKAGSSPDLQRFQQIAEVTGDINLIGRAGYLEKRGQHEIFEPDAFGQNMDPRRFILLPCMGMETAEKEMNRTPGRERYNVSGLVTVYQGQRYLLLRRTERTYTHGNFTQ
ncbi:MAG: hypothetical protein LLF76_00045 [Planctomycetaceae bacterium]|nr:hypothetical protein [Planctomycetaceae bacterium]